MRTTLLLTLLLVTSLHADEFQSARTIERANLYIDTHRVELGIDGDNELRLAEGQNASLAEVARFEQWYRGVKVRNAWLFFSVDEDGAPAVNDRRVRSIDVDVKAVVRKEEAKHIAETTLAPMTARDADLLIVPRRSLAEDSEPVPQADRLTWVVMMNGGGAMVVYVDAHSGEAYFIEQTQLCGGPPPLPQT